MRFSLILTLALVLVGCAQPTQNFPTTLSGYYKSSIGDGFSVSGTTFTQYDNSAKDVSFAGTIANAPDLTASAGTIIVKITDGGTWGKTVGHYYAARWKNLSAAGVKQECAYPDPSSTTLASAVQDFGADSLYPDAYFAEYAKQ
jgi:hypothetical protein